MADAARPARFDRIYDALKVLLVQESPPVNPSLGIYVQLYDFRMFTERHEFGDRGIYSYHGLQTNVRDANQSLWRGRGLVFSRFETSDPAAVRVAPDGWPEFPTAGHKRNEGGPFVGVRKSFLWGKGIYRCRLAPTDENAEGIWYELTATNLDTGVATSCGSLRFPTIDGVRPLIPNNGSSWIEIYKRHFALSNFPAWDITFSGVVANDGAISAQRATASYDDDQAPGLNSDVSIGGSQGRVDFRVGRGVTRATPNGKVLPLVGSI
jgi:hypothetical protein